VAQSAKSRSKAAGKSASKAAAPARQNPQPRVAGKLKVALLGFGTVGSAVARLILQDQHSPFVLTHVFNRDVHRKKVDWLPDVLWTQHVDDVLSSDADIIVELVGGVSPAGDWVRKALQGGKSVVTANKLLIAESGPELLKLAQSAGRRLEFGASVAGGIPAIVAIQEGLMADRLQKIEGILNGTCNYILTSMEAKGTAFADALSQAQKLGFAEADPRGDVEGYDARAKLVILTQTGLRLQVYSEQIFCAPISTIEAVDFLYARELNCTIRQISLAKKEATKTGVKLFAFVRPALVPLTSLIAHVQANRNIVLATGEFAGQIALSGYGAGGDPTAVAVVSDLYAIARRPHAQSESSDPATGTPESVSGELTVPHYLRFVVRDRPGIIAEVAAVLSKYSIGIDAILQKTGYPESALPFTMTLEACSSFVLEKALEEIARMNFHVESPLCLPILLD
jgi:homoserine dehydrogenase